MPGRAERTPSAERRARRRPHAGRAGRRARAWRGKAGARRGSPAGPGAGRARGTGASLAAFRRWRRGRPFWGGLWLLLGGVTILAAPLAPLHLIAHQGVAGVSGYLTGLALLATGPLSWLQPAQRHLLGVVAMLLALASFVTSDFGGFGVGMLLGLVGAALLLAWLPGDAPSPIGSRPPRGSAGEACASSRAATDGAPTAGGYARPMPGRGGAATPGADGGHRPGAYGRLPAVTALPLALVLTTSGATILPARPESVPPGGQGHRLPLQRPGAPPAGAVPPAAAESGLSAGTFIMRGARFDGVAYRPTADGPRRYLRLSMESLRIAAGEQWSHLPGVTLRQALPVMTMSGGVVLHVTRLRARIGGLEITFTPERPPLLLPPHLAVTGLTADHPVAEAAVARIAGFAQTARPGSGRRSR
ncbi:DUF6114 domain-containing protein [Sphaerisporangium melleum]|nr:DUF6114 domain-containing protein [Sphaerisporangium melleum]